LSRDPGLPELLDPPSRVIPDDRIRKLRRDRPSLGDDQVDVLSGCHVEGRTFDGWTTTIVETEDGNMLAFQNRNNTLTDIWAHFERYEETIEGTKRLPKEHLSPVIERTADDRYTTVIFVDEGISPPGELRVSLRLTAGGGLFHGMGQDTYRTEVRETVPAGTGGRIVVDATVEKY